MSTLGKIFVDYWIQCGRCEHMEALAARTMKAAQEARSQRGWMRRYRFGYICPDCRQEIANLGAERIRAREARGK
jgi:uncharacterized protein YlaI